MTAASTALSDAANGADASNSVPGAPSPSGAANELSPEALADRVGLGSGEGTRGWFARLVTWHLKRYEAQRASAEARGAVVADARLAPDRARRAIRWASIKSAITGASAGMVSTGATIFTAQTEGIGAFVAVPVAAVTIGGEMMYRSLLHVDLTCELADIFGVRFDPNDQRDLWRLYALAFGTHGHEEGSEDPGKKLVDEVSHVEAEQVGEKIGHQVLGESVMRNIVPVLGIASSAVTNYLVTRRLGDTLRRYMRYQRAMHDALAEADALCAGHLDLLVEGMWFIFSADGKLAPEEAACLAHQLQKLDPITRAAVTSRFVEDETEWKDRIAIEVPEAMRDAFLHALEVAAAVDKEVGLPERKILRRAARALGRELDMDRLRKMMSDFEEHGFLEAGAESRHR